MAGAGKYSSTKRGGRMPHKHGGKGRIAHATSRASQHGRKKR